MLLQDITGLLLAVTQLF